MPHEISKHVYGIALDGSVVLGRLAEDGEFPELQPIVMEPVAKGIETSHLVAMVFPATPANYDALQILYEDIKVPPIPMEPNDIVHGLLKMQKFVIVKTSSESYELAREKLNSRANLVHSGSKFGGKYGSWAFRVPYDVHGNEITELPCDLNF